MKKFFLENKWILLLMLALFLERVIVLYQLGAEYSLESDDLSYVNSGIAFANSGAITMHGVLSAQIMPGMPVLIGVFVLIFGEGHLLWIALKLFWIIMGTLSAYYVYKSITIYAPAWCGLFVTAFFFLMPQLAWMDNLILTETPFMLFFSMMIYSTLMMGKTKEKRYFYLCLVSYFLALMMKANIGIYPIFAFIYLLLVKYDFKLLLKQGLILVGVLLCFIVPWSIRNYIHYDAFIPLTYGAGNPMLLGTYQGKGFPLDEELDYETNVYQVAQEKFSSYYDENGEISENYLKKYVSLETDGIMARYRMKEWAARDPISMLKSYLIYKPAMMVKSVFYWKEIFGISGDFLSNIRIASFVFCALSFLIAVFRKKYWKELVFLAMVYLGNIYLYAISFAFDRYAETLMPAQYIACGLGIYLIVDFIKNLAKKRRDIAIEDN